MAEKRLNILVVNWQDRENRHAGGAEVHLHELFGRLARRGHRVTLLVSGWSGSPGRVLLDGMEVHRVGSRYTFQNVARGYFQRVLADRPFDVLIEDMNKVPLFVPRWSTKPSVLLVHHLFGSAAFRSATPPVALATVLLERLMPAAYRHVPTIAVSRSTAEDLEHRGIASAGSTMVIPNGIELPAVPATGFLPRTEAPTLLFLGRLQPYKGVDTTLRAVARLRTTGVETHFWIAGQGPAEASLKRLAGKLGLGDHVQFLGRVDEQKKSELLQRAWLHVLPSSKEGWGITVLEAGGYRTPTVASDAPGLREAVQDGVTGLLVPTKDTAAWAAAIERLIRDRALAERMGEAARAYAEGFDWERIADQWESYLLAMPLRAGSATGTG